MPHNATEEYIRRRRYHAAVGLPNTDQLPTGNMYRPLPYTANPIYLLFKDVALFLGLTLDIRDLSLLSIIWPVRPTQSKLDELALTRGNIWAIFLHVILIFAQLGYLSFVFVAPLCGAPAILYFGVLVGGIWSNKLFCDATLNGFGGRVRYAGGKYAADPTDLQRKFHPTVSPHERWVFVNGVAVGSVMPVRSCSKLTK